MKAIARAPAKVIITGEHFVVHGAWALAAAVGRHVTVEVQASHRLIVTSDRFGVRAQGSLAPSATVVELLAREFSFSPRLRVSIKSAIPNGSGLGSSAATMVALVAAISKLQSLNLTRREIIDFSMAGEREIHGNPSGIDSTVCAMGGVLLFRPGGRPRPVHLDGDRRLLVIFSGKSRSTRKLVKHVSLVKERLPNFFAGLADGVGELGSWATARLVSGDMDGLGRVMTCNHAILSAVGVSTPELDKLVNMALAHGSYGAKLTGAGGGGSIIAVAPIAKEKRIISEVSGQGFEAFSAVLPVKGVESWLEQ